MHFIVEKTQLVNALQHVYKAVSTKTTIPILAGIKFDVDKQGLTLTGSDSNISIQLNIPTIENDKELVNVLDEGKLVLPKYIVEIVKKLPSNEIEFKMIDQFIVIIKSGTSEFRLNGFDAEEFPNLPEFNEDKVFTIQSALLKTMIRQTIFAVATVESRPILTGILWSLEDQNLKFAATDSHRLAKREAVVEGATDISFNNVVIPGKSLNELSKILTDDQTPIKIIVNDNQIIIKINNLLFISRLLDGTYPDISRLIPNSGKINITLQTKDLLEAIERASLIATDSKNNVVKLITLDNLLLEISSNFPEIGKVTEQVQANDIQGEEIKISFNAKYTIDALKVIDSQEILIEFTGALSPFVIKPLDHNKMLHLIVPLRTY